MPGHGKSKSQAGELTDGSVQSSHIIDEAVTSEKLADNIAIDGALSVAGNTTLGNSTTGTNLTHINGSLLVDMDKGVDSNNNHPQFRIHAADGEGQPTASGQWTTARVILDRGGGTLTHLDIGSADEEWYYVTTRCTGFRTRINDVEKFRITADTTHVKNDLTVDGATIMLPNLPTGATGLTSGTVYQTSNGFLKVAL